MAPPPHSARATIQVMILTLRGFDLPNRWLGLWSFDAIFVSCINPWLHGTLERDYVPFLQSGADRHHGETGQTEFHLFLDPAFGALNEYVGTAFLGKDRREGRDHGIAFHVENDFRASRKIGNDAGIRLFQFDADGDFAYEAGAEGAGLRHGTDAYQSPGQFDIGIRVEVDHGFHAQTQFLGVHLVDGGIENHGSGVHD